MKIALFDSPRLRDVLVVSVLGGVLMVAVPEVLLGQKGKLPPNGTASVTFRNDFGDRILGDGFPYQHGQGGVSAELFAASGDLILDLGGSGRAVHFDFSDAVEGSAPAQALSASVRMNIEAIGKMSVGAVELRPVRIGLMAAWPKHVLVFREITRAGFVMNGTPVLVHRSGSTTWEVMTDNGEEPTQAGDVGALFEETTVKGKTVQTRKGRFRMPWGATVTCLSACPQ